MQSLKSENKLPGKQQPNDFKQPPGSLLAGIMEKERNFNYENRIQ